MKPIISLFSIITVLLCSVPTFAAKTISNPPQQETVENKPNGQKFLITISGRGTVQMEDQGMTIRVNCSSQSSCVCVQISDNGSVTRASIFTNCAATPSLQFNFGHYSTDTGYDGEGYQTTIGTFYECSNFVGGE